MKRPPSQNDEDEAEAERRTTTAVSTYYRGTATTSSDRGSTSFCPGRTRRHPRLLGGKSATTIPHNPKRNYSGNGKDTQVVGGNRRIELS